MNTQTIDSAPVPPHNAPKKPSKWPKAWAVFKKLFVVGLVLGLFALIFIGVYIIRATRDLPSVTTLQDYSPAVMSRVHAGDGKLIAEYGIEKRVFVPIQSIPKQIQHALVASEDQRFYTHNGFDLKGFGRAMVANIGHLFKGERFEGGSTLTQQVAKHFLVGNERKIDRKIREIFIAKRIEKAMSKDTILELYLNDVFFGRRAYGIAGASLNYFNKPLDDLSIGQSAYLAGLVKGPNNYQPDKNMQKALNRRNYVLNRMEADGYISNSELLEAKQEDLVLVDRLFGDEYLAAEYFVAEVRKQINKLYGETQLNEGGLSIRTTLDTKMQLAARKALRRGLEMYDRRHGYRGPLGVLDMEGEWQDSFKTFKKPVDTDPWVLAIVSEVDNKKAQLALLEEKTGTLSIDDIDWAAKALEDGKVGLAPKTIPEVLSVGDVILVELKPKSDSDYNLRQVPEVNGGLIAMDPHTGRVLALVGGYSFNQNQFNRATQAYRQPGSAFKPFVYAAALDSGFTPVSKILDAPFVIEHNDRDESCKDQQNEGLAVLRFGLPSEDGQSEDGQSEDGQSEDEVNSEVPETVPSEIALRESLDILGVDSAEEEEKECGPRFYKPANFNAGRFYGLSTLRLGLEKSRNAMTVRLANDIGMTLIGRYGRNFGIYDETKPELAWALGAGETTLLRLASAYASIVNGGKKVTPTLLDRVQDNKGKTVYLHDNRSCPECAIDNWDFSTPPELPDERDVVLSPVTSYQITSLLEGVVKRGTGRQMLRLGRPIAGKTGTTNDFKDAWFMGFSPDLVTGVYVGYDLPRSLGTETGAKAAGPIFRFFMNDVLKNKPKVSFRIPEGVSLVPVDQYSGEPSYIGAPGFIYEAFKPGTEPRIGGVGSKINIGGRGNDNLGYDYEFGKVKTGTPADKVLTKIDKPEGKGQNPETVKNQPVIDKSKLTAPLKNLPKTNKKPKKPEQTQDEVDLDDGLY
ncbi:MAG: penicillin-binding protein 1A [Robiginitomaculum sp.]|nr:penicillin-binding protein 1A [Robiginitomaculum sp.]